MTWELLGSSRDDGVLGSLEAWDPVTQELVWEVEQDGFWNAGTLTTAGDLVLQGRQSGQLVAYHAATGEELWRFDMGLGVSAPPITYSVGGRQYVSILVGWGGGAAGLAPPVGWVYGAQMRRLVTFSLEGSATLPPQNPPIQTVPLMAADFEVDALVAEAGALAFGQCAGCHGPNVISGGMAPDLRASAVVLSAGAFERVVRQGELTDRGMPRYSNLTDEQLLSIRHYIRGMAENPSPPTIARIGGD